MVASVERPITAARNASWRVVGFGDVVRNVDVTEWAPLEHGLDRVVGLEHLDPESLHIRRWADFADGTSFSRKFATGQVLFGKRRAYQRKVAVAEFDGICSGDILVFEPADGRLLPELLPFIVQSEGFFRHALGTSAGSLSPRTKWRDLANYEFPLPPLDEQRRIAELLWAVDQSKEATRELSASVAGLRHALQLQLFPSDFDQQAGAKGAYSSLNDVLVHSSDGPFGSYLKTAHYSETGARVVRLQNIEEGTFNDEDAAFIPLDYYHELADYQLRKGDVLVAGLGDETHPVGRACLVPEGILPAIHKADCFCLRSDPAVLLPEYLCHFLNSSTVRRRVYQVGQGTTRLRINVGNLRKVRVWLPNMVTQSRVCHILAENDEAAAEVQRDLAAKEELAKRLLAHLIGGRV